VTNRRRQAPRRRGDVHLHAAEDGGNVDDCISLSAGRGPLPDHRQRLHHREGLRALREHARVRALVDRSVKRLRAAPVQGPRCLALVAGMSARPPAPDPSRSRSPSSRRAGADLAHRLHREDGVEILVPAAAAGALWDACSRRAPATASAPSGWARRDTLRLEARLCLYGNDIRRGAQPARGGLGWVVKGKGFVARTPLARVRAEGVKRR